MKYLALDLRALALMRIGIALVLIIDLLTRLTDLEVFYTDTGAVPLEMLFSHLWNYYYVSVHTISGNIYIQFLLFMLAVFCALMLLIGYRTRLFTVLSWFLLMSLHNRNELILQGGDDLLRMVLFWAMFLPWGKKYSCDALYEDQVTPQKIRTAGTVAYVLQIAYVYTGSALLKGVEWHTEGTALYYVYSLDQIAYPVTQYLYHYPELLSFLTFTAWYFELIVGFLFFIPFRHGLFRWLGVVLVFGFHIFNGLTIFIGLFYLIGIVTAIGLVPSFMMDRIEKQTGDFRKAARHVFFRIAFPVRYFIPAYVSSKKLMPVWEKVRSGIIVFLIVYVLYWNLTAFAWVPVRMDPLTRALGYALRLDQCWGMFAPGVFKEDGWYIYEGTTASGERIDLLHPRDSLTYAKPVHVVRMFRNDRWRKYSENFVLRQHSYMRGYFCNYYKRKWNENHPEEKITSLQIIYMMELTEPHYAIVIPEKVVLFECLQ